MINFCCLLLGLTIGVFIGLLIASLCTVSKLADEAIVEINKDVVGSMEDDGK